MENQEGQSQEQKDLDEQQNVAPSAGVPAPDISPPEQTPEQAGSTNPADDPQTGGLPPKPGVDDPDLPEQGDDPQQFEPEPVQDTPGERLYDQEQDESGEKRDQPNDLSGVDKEFDDDEEDQ